jgi:hypothetical protein
MTPNDLATLAVRPTSGAFPSPEERERAKKERERAKKRRQYARDPERQRARKRRERAEHLRPFVGVDGEGGNTGPCGECKRLGLICNEFHEFRSRLGACMCFHRHDAHRHEYWLLRAGDHALEHGRPLDWRDCLAFLADLDPEPIYVGYVFGYDVNQIVKDLPPAKAARLNDRTSRVSRKRHWVTFPVDLAAGPCSECDCADFEHASRGACVCSHPDHAHRDRFEIDYLPGKFFKVRRPGQKWIEISETFAFFQQSFLKTLEDWQIGTPEEREQIKAGKAERVNFRRPDDAMRSYNALEIRLMAQLMEEFRRVCQDARLPIKGIKWQGPGCLAKALLAEHEIPKAKELPFWTCSHEDGRHHSRCNKQFREDMNATFGGGRFETSAVGEIPDHIYSLDIGSAYPYVLTTAPCLVHGKWTRSRTPTTDLYIAYGTFRPTEDALFYGLFVRNRHGGISYPASGGGWYWSFEIAASIHQQFTITKCWNYHKRCDCQPFDWIPAIYEERRRIGKSLRGKVLKLVLNSLYGSLCQRVGAAAYNNLVWASFITASVRTMLQTLINSLPGCQEGGRKCGDDVWYVATDGILTSRLPKGFAPTKALGAWDLESEHPAGVFVVQPGLYFGTAIDQDGERKLPKTRGISLNMAREHEDSFRKAFRSYVDTGWPEYGAVNIPMRTLISLRLAMHLNRPDSIGQWETRGRAISFRWAPKRAPEGYYTTSDLDVLRKHEKTDEIEYLRTYPPDGDEQTISMPYSKEIAKFLDRADLMQGMDRETVSHPDFMPYLAAPEEDY